MTLENRSEFPLKSGQVEKLQKNAWISPHRQARVPRQPIALPPVAAPPPPPSAAAAAAVIYGKLLDVLHNILAYCVILRNVILF